MWGLGLDCFLKEYELLTNKIKIYDVSYSISSVLLPEKETRSILLQSRNYAEELMLQ